MADILPLIVFIVSIVFMFLCLVLNVRVPCPKALSNEGYLRVDISVPPLIGVVVLLATEYLTFYEVIIGGIVGDKEIQPFSIVLILFGLAYLCLAMDATGVLTFAALSVVVAAGSSKYKLFIFIFLFACVMTALTNNDITVICLTPVVIQCAKFAKISPWPHLYGVYYGANTFSVIFASGNPTNVLIAGAFNLTFIDYLTYAAFPSIVSYYDNEYSLSLSMFFFFVFLFVF